jgi:hypothetical protein
MVVNQSSLVVGPPSSSVATISGRPELLVTTGSIGERTTAGERLVEAHIQVIVAQRDGTPIWMGTVEGLTPNTYLDYRLAVQPYGAVDGARISLVILRDLKIVTVEGEEREARRRATEERAAEEARVQAEKARAEEAQKAQRAAQERERRRTLKREQDRAAAIKAQGWSPEIERAVIGRSVLPGMTHEQVRWAWGDPVKVNETIRASGVWEQWVYSLSHYVYFDKGRVVAIQTTR